MMRAIDENANFGLMLTIHSITMLLGVFCLTTLTYSYTSYSLIVSGGVIGAFGSVFLIFEAETWAFIMFVVAVSIGESI